MFTAKEYAMPQNLDEAYKILTAKNTNCILGGCAWLKMGQRRINTAVDLSDCGLDYIRETDDAIEIGAMTSYRSVETSSLLLENFSGVLSRCVAPIIGIQFRNTVTVGGSVYSRFGFSDFLTPLLALDATVVLYKAGAVALADFMKMPYKKDIIEKIVIKKNGVKASYQMLRNAEADFPIVNLALSKTDGDIRVAVGARSGKAVLAAKTSSWLSENSAKLKDEAVVKKAQALLEEEVAFSTNMRASSEYRCAMAKVLLSRAILEVAV